VPIGAILVGVAIVWVIVSLGSVLWPFLYSAMASTGGFGLGATLFNALMLFGFLGSLMISATTVANSSRMEYLMTMPISLRTLFLEKAIIVIIYNSMIWLVIGTPIFIGLGIVSPAAFSLLSVPIFVIGMLALVTLGVSLGGILGLAASKIFAGRRLLKQIGYALVSAIGIIGGTLWYVSIYTNNSGAIFEGLFQFTDALGLSSDITPGFAIANLAFRAVLGFPIFIFDLVMPLIFALLGFGLLYGTAILSEEAHYSGWLASDSKRTSKKDVQISGRKWDPQPIPGVKLNQTTSVSMWYNIASVKRDARVLTQYLLGPLRYVIWLVLPGFAFGSELGGLTGYLVIGALIPFATSYGLSFAGYETVYEGKNLMNLQLAATNLQDYVKGKAYSAVPFSLAGGIIGSVLLVFISPGIALFLPAVVICLGFLTLASGAVAANAAAMGGDFKAERRFERQRGAGVQMPIRGWSMLRASLIPMLLGFSGILGIVIVGELLHPIVSYLAVPLFAGLCYALFNHYSRSAGRKLATIEASEYL
ncbi:MAG: hypothetical protein P1Q69_19540, partial [Candidatus Thorarchaeota archaeon]|nr:hypothetical protein [Candidatus Thorarchaeota archaeon]